MIIITSPKTKADILELIPFKETYSCMAGGRRHEVKVTATLVDGGCIELDQVIDDKSGDSMVPDYHHEALPVYRQIASLPPIQYLTVFGEYSSSLEDEHDYQFGPEQFDDGLPQLRAGERYEITIPLQPVDWAKVRRRIEDRLRKDPESVKIIAGAIPGILLY